jgi:hypothetical protein
MTDAESPATVFELLYYFFPDMSQAPAQVPAQGGNDHEAAQTETNEGAAADEELAAAQRVQPAGGRFVYDNACNALTYALNRDPKWARQWRMFIDKLHFKGHTACAASLDAGVLLLCRMQCCFYEEHI